jgi:deazaflavin-dependent oxidoreductase (nitroreductase family)
MTRTQTRKLPKPARVAMQFQAFLLRHNLLGGFGKELMVITTTGRKSGKRFSTPIGYLQDGETILALSIGGASNWFRNVVQNHQAMLEVKGRFIQVHGVPVIDPAERQQIFELYRRERARSFKLLFGVPVNASPEEMGQALESRQFVRFRKIL